MLCGPVALASLVSFVAALDVQGGSACPTPAEVAEHIEPLLVNGAVFAPGATLRIEGGPGEMEVLLVGRGGGEPLARRRLSHQGSCGELAEAAAVIAASWAGQYEAPTPGGLPSWDGGAPAADLRRAGSSSRADQDGVWSVGAAGGLTTGAVGETGDRAMAPCGSVEVTAARPGVAWFGRIALAGMGERELALDAGSAAWWRLLVAPSVGGAWGGRWFFEASAGPVLGPVFARGQGFSPNATDVSLAVGVSPAARVGWRLGEASRAAVWAGFSALAWVRHHRVTVDSSSAAASLPRLDVMMGMGATLVLSR